MKTPMSPWVRRLLDKGWRFNRHGIQGKLFMVSPEGKSLLGNLHIVLEAKK